MTATAQRTVQNLATHPGGRPYVNRRIAIRLNTPSFVDGGHREVSGISTSAITDETGLWSIDLDVNSGIDPADTWYTVQETQGLIWAFRVPDGDPGVPVWLRDCLIEAPENTQPIQAGVQLPAATPTVGQVLVVVSVGPPVVLGWGNGSGGGSSAYPSSSLYPSSTLYPQAA